MWSPSSKKTWHGWKKIILKAAEPCQCEPGTVPQCPVVMMESTSEELRISSNGGVHCKHLGTPEWNDVEDLWEIIQKRQLAQSIISNSIKVRERRTESFPGLLRSPVHCPMDGSKLDGTLVSKGRKCPVIMKRTLVVSIVWGSPEPGCKGQEQPLTDSVTSLSKPGVAERLMASVQRGLGAV